MIPRNGILLRHTDPTDGGYQTVREQTFDIDDLAGLVRTLLAN